MHALLVAMALAATAPAEKRLERALQQFSDAKFAACRDALATLVDDPSLSPAQAISARTYLAASYHALNDVASARAQLVLLFRDHRDARIDPSVFLPDLIALAEQARIEVAQKYPQQPPTPPPLAPAPPAAVAVTEAPKPGAPAALKAASWVATGLALAGAGVGVALGVAAKADERELNRTTHSREEVDRLIAQGQTKATAANVLFAVAGVTGLTATTLFIVEGTF